MLRSFADPVIDRTLTLQENLANIEAEPLERPDVPDLSAARAPLMKEDSSERLARALQQPFFEAGATTGSQHLIDTALLIDSQFFRNALADALDLSFERTDAIIGQWPDSHLPIALKALGLSPAECYLVMTAILGPIDTNRDSLREFVHIYRSIDREKRWRSCGAGRRTTCLPCCAENCVKWLNPKTTRRSWMLPILITRRFSDQ